MGYLTDQAQAAKSAANAVHGHHSSRTFNPGHPDVSKWMRDTLVALQEALSKLGSTNVAQAETIERQARQITELDRRTRALLREIEELKKS